jgi:phenylalanyl-tRNA synthetase beta chain
MKVPLSWLNDYVDVKDLSIEELAHKLTLAGLEVEQIDFIGLPLPAGERHDFKLSGLAWDKETIVVGEILEVMPHPNADRLVLCRLNDGQQEHVVLTGAPNLFEFKGKGPLEPSLKSPYAKEGATIYDGHQEGFVLTTLKRTKIRGVESYSMICSEKELGISDEHEGIMFLPQDAPTGMPLADYMGDAVLDIAITPNIARNANIFGVARETAAIFKRPLRQPDYTFLAEGEAIDGQVKIEINNPEMNPRFVLGLIRNVEIKASPRWLQHRLKLIGQRPINNIVDVTNYVMFDIGQPLHAFDYDELVSRAGGNPPTIITRVGRLHHIGLRYGWFTFHCWDHGWAGDRGHRKDHHCLAGRGELELYQYPENSRLPAHAFRSLVPILPRRASCHGRARRAARAGTDAANVGRGRQPGAGRCISSQG